MIAMEYRDNLRVLLLDGLPAAERHERLATIEGTRAAKLAKLRQADTPNESVKLVDARRRAAGCCHWSDWRHVGSNPGPRLDLTRDRYAASKASPAARL